MYGLLLEAISDCIKNKYGEAKWIEILEQAKIGHNCFSTHEIYREELIPNIAQTAAEVLGENIDDLMDYFGVSFVSFVGQYGYDRILKVLGRNMRDFLNGLDNLHEYLRFSYPNLKPPSFFVDNESRAGLTLHYRSRRKGYLHYVKGQIRRVGELFYNTKINIYVVDQMENPDSSTHVKFRLLFDNVAFRDVNRKMEDSIVDNIPLRSEMLFDLFPFHLVFGRKMIIRSVGAALGAVLPELLGKPMTEVFCITRPITRLTWEEVLAHTNNVFELVSTRVVRTDIKGDDTKSVQSEKSVKDSSEKENDEILNGLHVKGQMLFISEWESIMFLGTPIMKSLDDMFSSGLYINDLSMHDSSRDLVLAGTQQSAELKLALDQEQEKSRLLGESMKKLDAEMKRTDALLYQMIPKPVADRLRRGEPSVATCQAFDNVTILFSDVVGFTTICSRITPMEVVSMLNAMYTEFDQLSETHNVYKVETIGDAYMAVAGAPTVTRFHALNMCNMALDMLLAMTNLKDPSNNESMRIRVGVHTGATVAGVVGIKMPRYCLFGDTVNTASRMETNGEAMKIHISETTRQELEDFPYKVKERGEIEVKGKGSMKTYWLMGRDDDPAKMPKCPFAELVEQERKQQAHNRSTPDEVSGHRSVYSPVSFNDVNADQKHSPGVTPQPSPSRQAHAQARRGSKASGQHVEGRGSTPAGTEHSSVHSTASTTTKPTQAVPPTRSGSSSSMANDGSKPDDVITATRDGKPDNRNTQQQLRGNGIPHQHQPFPHVHSINDNKVVNNNDKTGHAFPVPASATDRRHTNNSGRSCQSGSNRSPAKKPGSGNAIIKYPPHDQGMVISDGRQKDSRTEKPKSKTCILL